MTGLTYFMLVLCYCSLHGFSKAGKTFLCILTLFYCLSLITKTFSERNRP